MGKHFKYLVYILRHKWYVLLECCKLGIPMRGLLHDISKFKPSQWLPYVNHFYGEEPSNHEKIKNLFRFACLQHQHDNSHHWQHWILIRDNGEIMPLPIPSECRKELLADWRGAGKAKHGYDDSQEWYLRNKECMILHEETREWIEEQLGIK